jgi:hypothetical protein
VIWAGKVFLSREPYRRSNYDPAICGFDGVSYQSVHLTEFPGLSVTETSGRIDNYRCYKSIACGIFVGLLLSHFYMASLHDKSDSGRSGDGHGGGHGSNSAEEIRMYNTMQASHRRPHVSIGPRAYFLIESLDEEDDADTSVKFKRPGLKEKLRMCARLHFIFRTSDFVIGHRGAALQFPEHVLRGMMQQVGWALELLNVMSI